jgi:hypothetical protein
MMAATPSRDYRGRPADEIALLSLPSPTAEIAAPSVQE